MNGIEIENALDVPSSTFDQSIAFLGPKKSVLILGLEPFVSRMCISKFNSLDVPQTKTHFFTI